MLAPNDPKLVGVVPLDPRIHFALNCGASSCPSLRAWIPENIDGALSWATEQFLLEDLEIDLDRKFVRLSMIFKWYAKDFGANKRQLLEWCHAHAPSELRPKISALLGLRFDVRFKPYDWSSRGWNQKSDVEVSNDQSSDAD
jgi:hypothetical protein